MQAQTQIKLKEMLSRLTPRLATKDLIETTSPEAATIIIEAIEEETTSLGAEVATMRMARPNSRLEIARREAVVATLPGATTIAGTIGVAAAIIVATTRITGAEATIVVATTTGDLEMMKMSLHKNSKTSSPKCKKTSVSS